jgi:hypothetical protein
LIQRRPAQAASTADRLTLVEERGTVIDAVLRRPPTRLRPLARAVVRERRAPVEPSEPR